MTELPKSPTSFLTNALAMALGLAVIWALALPDNFAQLQHLVPYAPLLPCLMVFAVIAATEWVLRVRGGRSLSDLSAAPLRALSYARVGYRLLGLAATLALIALCYWLFPEYSGNFYDPYWQFLECLAPIGILVPFYFIWADTRVHEPRDEFVQFGLLVGGRWREVHAAVIRRHLLGWTVKAFFLPLMTVYLNDETGFLIRVLRGADLQTLSRYDVWFHISYTIDLLFCVIGYTATARLFDSHLRSVEPTTLGWVAALICYQPFYSVIGRFYLQYEGNLFWDNWLQPSPVLREVWGTVIILLSLLYGLSTVAFGLRFSNLTHRGIITSGPYRFSKHPAYLSKNLSWWLISVPFAIGQDGFTALRHCLLLLLLNGIYFLRARTEERHLSRDPTYVAYALWMNDHGALRFLGRAFPWLRYQHRGDARRSPALEA
ncbi:MAG TPA: isoprenylcysteine carboxylmethyltransferase family protein [Steroidobacteraceae bacterium]|nr:isoprenylcysteine carboxylmethyltransferase family protein [Steroidobacteraceae bacterium]